jgi:hypothetical protein
MAKILAVADAYNALISPRPFRPPLTPYAAMECILRKTAAGDFDPHVVRALLMVQSLFPISSYVVLSDGSVAKVLRRNGDKFTQPIVKIVQDSEGKAVPENSETSVIDLSTAGLDIVQTLPTPGTNAVQLSQEILRGRDADESNASSEMESYSGILQKLKDAATSGKAQISPMELISLEYYPEKLKRLASRAFDLLEGSRKMTDSQYIGQRKRPRTVVKSVVTIHPVDAANPFANIHSGLTFRAMSYDISPGGISFIYPEQLSIDSILIGMQASEDKKTWFLGKIVRTREIGDTCFWLHNVAFQQRVSM